MGGLKIEIADGIRMFKPKTLKEVISLARIRDDQLMRQRKFQRPHNVINQSSLPSISKLAPSMKRLTWSEMQQRRAQGLCFNCDDKFTTGHKCRGPQFLLLEGNENCYEEEAMGDILEHRPEISLHTLSGWSSYKTMRVLAKIGTHTIVVLIDSGSTHNFISNKMSTMLQLPVIPTKSFNVKVSNGEPLQCHGRFDNVPIHLQGIPFVLTLYDLPSSGLDLVLGVHWLEQLGTVICNWKQLTMEFQWNNETHKLQGLNTTTTQPTTMKVITKEARQGGSMFAIALPSTIDLNALPEGTDPINVRPYRYKPGRTNNAADALSRVTGSPSLHSLFVSHTQLWDLIRKDVDGSPYMRKIKQLATDDPSGKYRCHNGLVCYKN
ncbi:hypothetical protein V6N12_070271 [Hibiscus sabdariffa]|uniref:Uncharacterized protein n=1 Tax=Hibiscus sabdariffa TaxID=183260 RepID=A0ABR2FGB7_9ROSI